jgi:zinc transport system substrate-binding protein
VLVSIFVPTVGSPLRILSGVEGSPLIGIRDDMCSQCLLGFSQTNSSMQTFKKITILFSIAILFIVISGLFFSKKNGVKTQSKLKITTSFYPLAEFTRIIGGEFVDVRNITPPGAEPHDYEPSPQDIVAVQNSLIFVMNGNGLDAWGDKMEGELKKKGVIVIKMSDQMNSIENTAEGKQSQKTADPHFWLDPTNVMKEVKVVRDAIIKTDSSHTEVYNQNGELYLKKLQILDEKFKVGLSTCKKNEIIVSHNAFNYLAKRYGLTTFYISGLSPDEEPSPKRLADIANLARDKKISYIFFETLVSPKIATTIAQEVGAKTLVLNPFEGLTPDEVRAGKNYISVMEENLIHLRTALECP